MRSETKGSRQGLRATSGKREPEAGAGGFMADLFGGRLNWGALHPFPEQDEKDRQAGDAYIQRVRGVLEEYIDPDAVDRTGEIPNDALLAMAEIGLFGMRIPKAYGGLGLSQTNATRILAFVASYCNSTAAMLSAHQDIGAPEPVMQFGTKEQKEAFLPRLARGAVSGFALTEPDVGSDPGRMTTRADLSEDGTHYLLNGEKLWCTNGITAELLVVMALTHAPGPKGDEPTAITAFLVETDMPGLEIVHRCAFLGCRGIYNGLLRFRNAEIPVENMLGEPGDGLRIALTTLNTGRLTLPGMAAGCTKVCLHFSRDWATRRVQWGAPLGEHQSVGNMLAQMAANTFAMDSMSRLVGAFVDQGRQDIRLEAAAAKCFCTEAGWQIADDLVQLRGGRGYETAQSLLHRGEDPVPAERLLRDARVARIIQGTNEILRLFIAREGMGMHLKRLLPVRDGRGRSWRAFWRTAAFYAWWYLRVSLPFNGGLSSRFLSVSNRRHLEYIDRASRRLARGLVRALLRHGAKLEREQLVLQRFADAGTDLFAMAASLARAESLLAESPNDVPLQNMIDLFCRNARKRVEANLQNTSLHHGRLVNGVAQACMRGDYNWMTADAYTDFPPTVRVREREQEREKDAAPVE